MRLAEYIAANKHRLVDQWKELVIERLAMDMEESQLVDHIPAFIDELVAALEDPSRPWFYPESAQNHGRARTRLGIDIGAITEEMVLIIEAVCALGVADDHLPTVEEMRTLARVIGHGCSASVNAYAASRDSNVAVDAQRHLSFIAHELRTPLQAAEMAVELMRQRDGRSRYLRFLESSLAELGGLIDDAMAESRLTTDPLTDFEWLDAAVAVAEAVRSVKVHAEARDLSIHVHVQPFELEADRKLLGSALSNLLKNAVKFTRAGTSVSIRADAANSRALFIVNDECGGMPEDVPEHLFRPYVQRHDDRSGLGLGLVIVEQVAKAHHGAIRVVNRPGEGCSFVLELPLSQAPDDDQEPDPIPVAEAG